MGLLDDIGAVWDRWNAWTERAVDAVRDWVASEAGQNTLLGLDWLSLSVRIGAYYQHIGWYLPVHPAIHRYVLDRLETRTPFDARDAVRLVGPGSEHWAWIVEGTLESPSLSDRREVVEDAIFCLENERWHAAVSTLLPVIEGLIPTGPGSSRVSGWAFASRKSWAPRSAGGRPSARCRRLASSMPRSSTEWHSPVWPSRTRRSIAIWCCTAGRRASVPRSTRSARSCCSSPSWSSWTAWCCSALGRPLLPDSGSYLDEYGPLAELRAAGARRAAAMEDPTDT